MIYLGQGKLLASMTHKLEEEKGKEKRETFSVSGEK